MAITETRPATELTEEVTESDLFVGLADHDPGGLAGFIGTGDHKPLGRAYIAVSLVFGVGAFVLEALFRAHGAHSFLPDDSVDQVYTLGRIGLVLLFAIPLFVGFGTYLAPLQVGARTIAFPRAAAMAFWGWIIGSGLLIGSYAIANGGPDGGGDKGVDLALVALALILVSLVLASVCILTTIFALRTPGMHMTRIPMLAWSLVVGCSLWLFTMPVLLANLVLIYVDHHYGEATEFGAAEWSQLWWFFALPTIAVVAIPAIGAISDILTTLAGGRVFRRGTLMVLVAAFGILSFGAWAQPHFSPDIINQGLYDFMAAAIVVPVIGLIGGWAMALKGSKPLLKGSLLFALAAVAVLLVAVLASAVYVIKPLELHDPAWTDQGTPPFADGQMVLMVAVAALAGLGALVHWAPKILGRFVNDGLAKLAALIGLVGALLAGLPLMVIGFSLKFDGLNDSAKALSGASAAGSALLVLAILLVLVGLLGGKGDGPADDAWGRGQTLEWATSSPPPPANFGVLARVESAQPLLDAADAEEAS